VLPLAPPYLCYLAGASIESLAEEGGGRARRDIVVASLLFVAGFATVFVALGATATEFSLLLHEWSHALSIVAGLGIIVMGAHFLGLFRVNAMLREARLEIEKPPGLWSAYLMGVAFAFGWTPCIGPILAAIFAVAAAQQTVGQGALLLAAYSLGLGAPFVVAAIAMERFLAFSRGFRRQFARLEKATGALLVVTGVLFLTGGMQTAAQWLIDTFPRLGQLG
jgi:cytochrome c-type biogenesis protein